MGEEALKAAAINSSALSLTHSRDRKSIEIVNTTGMMPDRGGFPGEGQNAAGHMEIR